MYKTRIIKRLQPTGHIFVIQMKHRIWKWLWVDAWNVVGESVKDYYDTLGEAQERIHFFSNLPKKRDIPVDDINKPGVRDHTNDVRFWKRLELFTDSVAVNDLPGMEEKDMILNVCREKIRTMDI